MVIISIDAILGSLVLIYLRDIVSLITLSSPDNRSFFQLLQNSAKFRGNIKIPKATFPALLEILRPAENRGPKLWPIHTYNADVTQLQSVLSCVV